MSKTAVQLSIQPCIKTAFEAWLGLFSFQKRLKVFNSKHACACWIRKPFWSRFLCPCLYQPINVFVYMERQPITKREIIKNSSHLRYQIGRARNEKTFFEYMQKCFNSKNPKGYANTFNQVFLKVQTKWPMLFSHF